MKNTPRSLSTYVLCFFLPFMLKAQEWVNYSYGKQITGLVELTDETWIGTIGGLVKIDHLSEDTTFFNTTNSPITYSWVKGVVKDSEETIWGITSFELFKMKNGEWTIFDLGTSLQSSPKGMTIDSEDNIWIYTFNGVHKVKDGQVIASYTVDNFGLPADNVSDLFFSETGLIYVGTNLNGIGIYDGNTWTYYNAVNSDLPDSNINDIEVDQDGVIWVGTREGVSRIENGVITNINSSNTPMAPNNAEDIAIDEEGNVWVVEAAIHKYDGQQWQRIVRPDLPEFSTEHYHWIHQGVNNKIWLGITRQGLFQYDDLDWPYTNTSNSKLETLLVNDICIGPDQEKLIVGSGGANLITQGNWGLPYEGESELPNSSINTCAIDQNGVRWFGTDEGLGSYHNGVWTLFNTINSDLPSNLVRALEIDDLNRKWIGTREGLAIWDDAEWLVFTTANSELPNDEIYDIALDGTVGWIGTQADQLTRFDGSTWQNVSTTTANNTLCEDGCRIYDVSIAGDGTVWGSAEGRLFKFKDNTFSVISSIQTPSGHIPSVSKVAIDDSGILWLGAGVRLGRYDQNLDEVTFYEKEGLGRHFYSITDIKIDHSGNKWLATNAGLYKFHEEALVATEDLDLAENHNPIAIQKVFPNPTTKFLNIDFNSSESAKLSFEIIDVLGQSHLRSSVRRASPGANRFQLDLSHFEQGVYFLVGRNEQGQIFHSGKVLVED